MTAFWRRLRLTLEMIKFEHSVFALPFALTGALLGWRESGFETADLLRRIAWIIVAMVAARSAAMTFNRILDAGIDARNRRTANRAIPAGYLSVRFAWAFTIVTSLVFVLAAAELGRVCLLLSPVALVIVFFYSYTKRFTAWAHLWLGLSLGIAPAAAFIAVHGSLDPRMLLLTAAVMFWTAGFDVIYACQDFAFDCEEGLCSIPRKFGIPRALGIARLLHVLMVLCLFALVLFFHLGALSLAGILAVVTLLIYEHGLVKSTDLSRVNAAFFTVNGYVSLLFFAFWAADILFHRYLYL